MSGRWQRCAARLRAHTTPPEHGANQLFWTWIVPIPNQVFVVVIWGENRSKFGRPQERYRDRRIPVMGLITLYRGVPETIAREPSQIEVK